MKKWATTLFCLILCGAGGQAFATPLLPSTAPIRIGENPYTITNRHRASDLWSTNHDGYEANDGAFSGLYLGTVTGKNDSQDDILNLIDYFLGGTYEISRTEKVDAEDTSNDFLSLTYDTLKEGEINDYISGTWSTTPSEENESPMVDFYTVKGSKEFALYYLDPASNQGKWITDHLLNKGGQIPGISHLSVVTTTHPDPVPEPATLILLGIGLIGMTGRVKKRGKKRAKRV